MVVNGTELKTYSDFDRYFHFLKLFTVDEVISYVSKMKGIEASEKAKEYAINHLLKILPRWESEYQDDSIMVMFYIAMCMSTYQQKYAV